MQSVAQYPRRFALACRICAGNEGEPSLLLFKLNYFIAGMLLFKVLAPTTLGRQRWLYILGATLLVSMDVRYHKQLPLEALLLLSMVTIGLFETRGGMPNVIEKLLDSRIVQFASDASYSVYLLHGFFISASGLLLSSYPSVVSLPLVARFALMTLFVTLGTYTAASIMFRFVEQPGVRMGKRFIDSVTKPLVRAA